MPPQAKDSFRAADPGVSLSFSVPGLVLADSPYHRRDFKTMSRSRKDYRAYPFSSRYINKLNSWHYSSKEPIPTEAVAAR